MGVPPFMETPKMALLDRDNLLHRSGPQGPRAPKPDANGAQRRALLASGAEKVGQHTSHKVVP